MIDGDVRRVGRVKSKGLKRLKGSVESKWVVFQCEARGQQRLYGAGTDLSLVLRDRPDIQHEPSRPLRFVSPNLESSP